MEYSSRHGEIEDSNGDSDEHGRHDTAGMGRSYECVFCKRGFTTAQALGGHMNIHRKDRAANKTHHRPSTHHHSKTDHEAYNMKSSSYSPIPSYPPSPSYYHHHGQSFFPAPAAQHVQFHGQQDQYQNINQYQHSSAPFVEHNWSWNLSLQVGSGSSRVDEDQEDDDRNNYDEYRRDSCVEEEEELDLELRLGHDP